jgi:hypothetical protein
MIQFKRLMMSSCAKRGPRNYREINYNDLSGTVEAVNRQHTSEWKQPAPESSNASPVCRCRTSRRTFNMKIAISCSLEIEQLKLAEYCNYNEERRSEGSGEDKVKLSRCNDGTRFISH